MKKKMNNKGFTLVELIVVLVILAILAAILVPALLGYIDRAKQQQIVLNGKSCLTAAQAELSAMYGQGKYFGASDGAKTMSVATFNSKVTKTADLPTGATFEIYTAKKPVAEDDVSSTAHENYTVVAVKYEETGKDAIIFDGGSWSTDNKIPSTGVAKVN